MKIADLYLRTIELWQEFSYITYMQNKKIW